jgi:hypothetical protein
MNPAGPGHFPLKSAHVIADTHDMGRLIQFPIPAGDAPGSENRLAVTLPAATPLRALDQTPLKGALAPSLWGVPRAFFIVHQPRTTLLPTPDQKLVC